MYGLIYLVSASQYYMITIALTVILLVPRTALCISST